MDFVGFGLLFYNGNFKRNFNRLDGFTISSHDANGEGGGMKALERSGQWPRVIESLGFGLVLGGFAFQLVSALAKLGGGAS